jgi:single-stranded-DNA-specific exonuclease
VSFVLLAALNREARRKGLFEGRAEPDLRQWLDLAALGAFCDVTQLTGFNRALAAQGLKVMSAWPNPGLRALMAAAGAALCPATAFHAGYVLGPRINAGGRIGRSDLGALLLSSDDPDEVAALASELDALNASRKEVERQVLDEAAAMVDREGAGQGSVIVVANDGWHPGVVGIVAGRLRERYRRPAIVIGVDPVTRLGKGSGRSQPGVNLGAAVNAAFEEGLLLAGGGHAMAAGVTVREDRVEALRRFLDERLGEDCLRASELDGMEIDALIGPAAANRALYEDFQRLAPFGPANPEPVFALNDVMIEQPMPLRGGHMRCTLNDGAGGRLKAVAWRCEDTELGRRLLTGSGVLHVAGRLKPDDYKGRVGIQLEIDDAADPRMRR